ncbi:MAG: hypothetical protein LBQ31_05410 [Bacteroidales bacterium]|nr:hypothetical protein [Bacteroidales bacterium]
MRAPADGEGVPVRRVGLSLISFAHLQKQKSSAKSPQHSIIHTFSKRISALSLTPPTPDPKKKLNPKNTKKSA